MLYDNKTISIIMEKTHGFSKTNTYLLFCSEFKIIIIN